MDNVKAAVHCSDEKFVFALFDPPDAATNTVSETSFNNNTKLVTAKHLLHLNNYNYIKHFKGFNGKKIAIR